jgi:hypothetical protein
LVWICKIWTRPASLGRPISTCTWRVGIKNKQIKTETYNNYTPGNQ